MPKRMLIDASHPEETRVVVLDGQKVEEFDFEAASKRPLKGNIYLAKVTRVEPSLQAAFVEYGGNRQGFLAFSEIHPDYYQIPVADRQALLAEQQAEARRRAEEEFEPVETGTAPMSDEELEALDEAEAAGQGHAEEGAEDAQQAQDEEAHAEDAHEVIFDNGAHVEDNREEHHEQDHETPASFSPDTEHDADQVEEHHDEDSGEARHDEQQYAPLSEDSQPDFGLAMENAPPENGESAPDGNSDQAAQPLRSSRPGQRWVRKRHYKIQEVIKRRQIILVQVVKEERGNKGAALTTYMSLAGRYCVLMPNTPRGGGISRKITNANDRKRLKSAAAALELPEGMGLIIRTAGENRTKVEIKRDYEYLLRMWDTIRETTLNSNAPACVYEEGDLIKRAIRDLYNKDVADITVEGDEGYKNAKDFMRMLMPSHAKNVKPYKEAVPLFQHHHIEAQLDAMFQPTVTLRSGGYIVINQTEALVSIDVNSGRATREHSIEETAHKTNLEAAEEIGRQLRLRDLAGLIVIDFIDMEDGRNDRNVEKRLRDAVKNDRARIQIGKISQFGLLEMSRQRLRAGVVAGSTVPCPHCGGQGIVRSVESTALRVLRGLEEEGQKLRSASVNVRVPGDVAIYTLNQKRRELQRIESDYRMAINFVPKDNVLAGNFEIERIAQLAPEDRPVLPAPSEPAEETLAEAPADLSEEVEETEEHEDLTHAEPTRQQQQQSQPSEGAPRKRRRRGGRGRSSSSGQGSQPNQNQHQRPQQQPQQQHPVPQQPVAASPGDERPTTANNTGMAPLENGSSEPPQTSAQQSGGTQPSMGAPRKRRRRRRGGRNRHESGSPGSPHDQGTGEHSTSAHNGNVQETYANAQSEPRTALQSDGPQDLPPAHEHRHVVEADGPRHLSAPAMSQDIAVASHSAPEPVARDTAQQTDMQETNSGEARKGWWQRTFRS